MVCINVKETLTRVKEGRSKQKELPKIVVVKSAVQAPVESQLNLVPDIDRVPQNTLIQTLWIEYRGLLVERNKLSTQISQLVREGATQGDLQVHYKRIESFRPKLQDMYDKIQHAEQHGVLPDTTVEAGHEDNIYFLKQQKSKLIDRRHKLNKKISEAIGNKIDSPYVASHVPKNPARIDKWRVQLDEANAEYYLIERKIKQLEGKA